MRIFPIFILGVLFFVSAAAADEVVLTNGNVLKGNIISNDEKKGDVTLDVVLEGELTGVKLVLKISEIKSIKKNDTYRSLVRQEISAEEKAKNQVRIQQMMEKAENVDQQILTRIQRIKDNIRYIEQQQEDKRRFEKELAHQKEMLRLELEAQKELITHAKSSGAKAGVNIYSGL